MSSEVISATRAWLPGWVVWAPMGSAIVEALFAAALATSAVALLSRPLSRLTADAHWTERARLVFPVRRAIAVSWVLAMIAAGPLQLGGAVSLPSPFGRFALGPLLSLAAVLAVAYAFEDRFVRRLPLATRWRGAVGYAVLVYPAYAVSGAFAAWATHARLAVAGAVVAGLLVVALASGTAPWLGRAVGLVRRAPLRVEEVLTQVLQRVGGPRPRLLLFPIPGANAFAFQLTGSIGVTQGALDALDDEELGAILAHELGHLREPPAIVLLRTLVAALIPVAVVVLPWVLALTDEEGWLAVWAFAVAVLLVYRRLQRALERRADAFGDSASPAYAGALEKIYRLNLSPAVLRRAGTHPDLVDRLASAGAAPTWPRPQPPPALTPTLLLLAALAAGLFAAAWQARTLAWRHAGDSWRGLALQVAIEGRASEVARLGYWHLERRQFDAALALFRGAEELDLADATWPAMVATALAYQGRCEEAGEAARRASSRGPASPYTEAAQGFATACTTLRAGDGAEH
jgi:Zn-dependent protease with chaperone function